MITQLTEFDAKTSREILKAIRYGIKVRIDYFMNSEFDSEMLKIGVAQLRKAFLIKRRKRDDINSNFGNVIFFQLLQEKYPEFQFWLDEIGHVRTNLYDFKINDRIPSLLTLLLNEPIKRISKLERRYGEISHFMKMSEKIENLFHKAQLVYPKREMFLRFLNCMTQAMSTREPLVLVSAICPDYSYAIREGKVRYTFESLGAQAGLAGNKFIATLPILAHFFEAINVQISVSLFGGDFESRLFKEKGTSFVRISQPDFIKKVRMQIKNIAGQIGLASKQSFFFDVMEGETAWAKRHKEIYARLAHGDFGLTSLSLADAKEIYASRKPLYSTWFKHTDEDTLWQIFLQQAAEYALMGQIYSKLYTNFVVFGVDHSKMTPFYSFSQPVCVIYRHTDYIGDEAFNHKTTRITEEEAT